MLMAAVAVINTSKYSTIPKIKLCNHEHDQQVIKRIFTSKDQIK